jgi:hypothetical protein
LTLSHPSDTIITVIKDSGGYMAKRARTPVSDSVERAKVVGSVLFFGLCGLALTAVMLVGPYGWIFSLVGAILLVLAFIFWPFIISVFWSVFQHKPKRAMKDE